MPKVDPRAIENPIRSKLAGDISKRNRTPKAMPTTTIENPNAMPTKTIDLAIPRTRARVPQKRAKLAKPKKVLFTRDEQRENDALLSQLKQVTGADTLGWSHVNRAMWSLLRRAEEQLEKHRSNTPQLSRPSNGDPIGLAQFEDTLADFLLTLLKDTPRAP